MRCDATAGRPPPRPTLAPARGPHCCQPWTAIACCCALLLTLNPTRRCILPLQLEKKLRQELEGVTGIIATLRNMSNIGMGVQWPAYKLPKLPPLLPQWLEPVAVQGQHCTATTQASLPSSPPSTSAAAAISPPAALFAAAEVLQRPFKSCHLPSCLLVRAAGQRSECRLRRAPHGATYSRGPPFPLLCPALSPERKEAPELAAAGSLTTNCIPTRSARPAASSAEPRAAPSARRGSRSPRANV